MAETAPETGIVKWFNGAKGFGFLVRENNLGDCFFHATDIKKSNIDEKTVDEGQKYSFVVVDTPRGIKATNLARVEA